MVFELSTPEDYRTIEFLQDLINQLKRGHLACELLHKETRASSTEKIRGQDGNLRPLVKGVDITLKFTVPFRLKAHHQ